MINNRFSPVRHYCVMMAAVAICLAAPVPPVCAGPLFARISPLDLAAKSEPFLCVPLARQSPVVDGHLDDPAWQSAAVISSWTRKDDAAPTAIPLSARFIADSSNLYVGLSMAITSASNANLKVPAGGRDEYGGSLVELFLQAGTQKVQICANPLGLRYDSLNDNAAWSGSWRAAGHVGETNWTLEIAIPAADLGSQEFKGASWLKANVCFVDSREQLFSWTGKWNDPSLFGEIFIGNDSDYAARIRSALAVSCITDRDVYDPRDGSGIAVFQLMSRGRAVPAGEFTAQFKLSTDSGKFIAGTNVALPSQSLGLDLDLNDLPEGRFILACDLSLANNTAAVASCSTSFQKAKRPIIPAGLPRGRIPLRAWPTTAATSNNWPVSVGIPFAQGVLASADNVRLLADDGKEMPCQAEIRSRWSPGGSVEWLGLDFIAPTGGASRAFTVEYGPEVRRGTFTPLLCSETPEQISIASELLKLTVSRKSFNLIDALYLDGNGDKSFSPNELVIRGSTNSGPYLVDHEGNCYEAALDESAEVILEEKGPVKATILATGWYVKRGSQGNLVSSPLPTDKLCQFRIRISVSASAPFIRFSISTVMTHDTSKVRLKDIAISLPLVSPEEALIGLEGGTNIAWNSERLKSNPYLLEHSWDKSADDAGHVYPNATGWAEVRTPAARLACAMRNFWKLFPKEIEFSNSALVWHSWPAHGRDNVFRPEDELTITNIYKLWYVHVGRELDFRFPDSYTRFLDKLYGEYKRQNNPVYKYPYYKSAKTANAQGLCLHNDYAIGVYPPKTPAGREGEILGKLTDEDPQVSVDPAYACGTGVFGPILHADYKTFAANEKIMDENFTLLARRTEQNNEYGQFIFGGWHEGYEGDPPRPAMHRVWANGHFALVRIALIQYARTGNPMYLAWARDCGNYLRDIAMVHYAGADMDPPRTRGAMYHCYGFVPWGADAHVAGHPVSMDWMAFDYFLTGNRRSRDTILEWTEALAQLTTAGGSGRESLQPLGDMVVAYRLTWNPALVPVMRRFAETVFSNPLPGQPWWDYNPLALMRYHGLTGNERIVERYREAAKVGPESDYGGGTRHLEAYFALLDNNAASVRPWTSRLYAEGRKGTTGHWIYYAYHAHKQPSLLKALDTFKLKPELPASTIPSLLPICQKQSLVVLRETSDRAVPINIALESWQAPLTVRIWNSGGTRLQDKRYEPPKETEPGRKKISLEIPADKVADDYLVSVNFGNATDCALWPVSDLPLEIVPAKGAVTLPGWSRSPSWAAGSRCYFKCGELAGKDIGAQSSLELLDANNALVWAIGPNARKQALPADRDTVYSLYAVEPGPLSLPAEGTLYLGLGPASLFIPRISSEPKP